MKARRFLLCAALPVLAFAGSPAIPTVPAPRVVACVEVRAPARTYPLPVRAHFVGQAGRDSLLVVALQGELTAAGWPFQVLADWPETAHLAIVRDPARQWRNLDGAVSVLDDGRQRVVVASRFDALAASGFEFALIDRPLDWADEVTPLAIPAAALALPYDARVAALLDRIRETNLVDCIAGLSGETAVAAQGDMQRVTSRHTLAAVPLRSALDFADERFRALGWSTTRHAWSLYGYTSTNLIATLPGVGMATQTVILCAHLDAMPAGVRNYGADDNASGCAAVLAAAAALRHVRLDRTVRLCLFTGEEQGLLGSDRYALQAQADGDAIVAVLNADMIAWDATGGPVANLFIRAVSNPGHAADRAIADTFTNIVATYLPGLLEPQILATGLSASDHASFWSRGYPAVLAIEDDYGNDFCAYYHTINDRLATLNRGYLTVFAKALAGTTVQLAGLVGDADFDVIQIGLADWQNATNGAGTMTLRHESGALDGIDAFDVASTNGPSGTNAIRFRVASVVDGGEFVLDVRPPDSVGICTARLVAVGTAPAFEAAPQLRFAHWGSLETQRLYGVRVSLDAANAGGATWRCVTNLRELVRQGGGLPIPALTNLTNGAVFGTVEISVVSLLTNVAALGSGIARGTNGRPVLTMPSQAGAAEIDRVEVTTNLSDATAWTVEAVVTNATAFTEAAFGTGAVKVSRDLSTPANGAARVFRVRRTWLPVAPGD